MTLLIVFAIVTGTVVASPPLVALMDRRAGWILGPALLVAAGVLGSKLPQIFAGDPLTARYVWARDLVGPGSEVGLSVHADGLSTFFALLALVIGGIVLIYSAAYLHNNDNNTSFYTIMTAFTLSVLILVLAGDVVLLFIGWELVSLASFLLIARAGSGGEAGSFRTLAVTFVGGLLLLIGLAIAAVSANSTDLSTILRSDVWAAEPGRTTVVAVLVALGAFTKAAQFPFHFWLPEAMAAATPVSAFLHAAAVVKAGVYVLLRFSTIFHDNVVWNALLIITGLFTAIMSAIFAATKTDLKQLTAYSTVSHLGWIVATIGVGTQVALAAALTHTLAHALFKSSLFMLIGVVDHQAGSRDIRRLGPLLKQMPFTFVSMTIAVASMAAVPPLFGFISKESMLTAFYGGPYGGLLLFIAAIAAFLTVVYSVKVIFGTFVDGPRDVSHVTEAPASMWVPAALPGLFSVPLAFTLPLIDDPVTAAVHSITQDETYHSHLHLWHGVTPELMVSVLVLAAGIGFIFVRHRVFDGLNNRELLPFNGKTALRVIIRGANRIGEWMARPAISYNPARHLIWLVVIVLIVGFSSLNLEVAPRVDGLDNYWDLVPLVLVTVSVGCLVLTRSRLTAAVLLGTVGVGVSLQMLMLGAPDVALTQFMVESLTVVVIMMVLRYQPDKFPPVRRRRKARAAVVAALSGFIAFAGVYGLLGRRERSDLAMWYLENTTPLTQADNIVAVIIVEFRSFDTLGELSVLGMAAVVIMAVTSSVPRHKITRGLRPEPFGQSQINTMPIRKVVRMTLPIMIVLSILIFFRGHQAPGGGFVAALVLATAFVMSYLSKGRDEKVVSESTPIWLTGIGIIIAISSGFLGLIEGGFMYAIHGEIAGIHQSTSLIFDVGIYMCVIGMLTMAINALGGYVRPGNERENLDYLRDGENPLPDVPAFHTPTSVAQKEED
ncbi:DUF4040 family protein [Corynebacterium aquatimens]|uniref:Multicomponent Na+:H+ antiporter subunit A n=1 Tax=Corynebacterium aquatimens TaxID=1190508 RepID=A0A931GS11_9CORY|nr:DUF4040 family protein [Corynebacterium aquatimens]MBG6122548.1 multicomponent Na+:H+ antiporter subunit A [Corynebacterium aquatimens]